MASFRDEDFDFNDRSYGYFGYSHVGCEIDGTGKRKNRTRKLTKDQVLNINNK